MKLGLFSFALLCVCMVYLCVLEVDADIFMSNPRGSNNRERGGGRNRATNNRLFNSQNNAAGGYVAGPPMTYIAGSQLSIEWTNQHSCGSNPKVFCNVVIQYMCNDDEDDLVRDGVDTARIPDDPNQYNQLVDFVPDDEDEDETDPIQVHRYGMHEPYQYYQDCKARERNRGLFTADRNMNGRNTARFTRQQNGGGQNGFECPEEREYYSYWHPTPWKDIAVLTHDTSRCSWYRRNSENNKGRRYCDDNRFNNKEDCEAANANWRRKSSHGGSIFCGEIEWSRDNHLGNTRTGQPHIYNWTVPNDPHDHCVLRIRYNISTNDYDPWNTYADQNGDASPIRNNPLIRYFGSGSNEANLSLALNTAQFGRTFQDRSHTFRIRKRPSRIGALDRIFNLNVRGKRGNIVQVFPSVEYDAIPNMFHTKKGDWVHVQWTGGNQNPANNDGEGRARTDRSNFVQIPDLNKNLPSGFGSSSQFFGSSNRRRLAYLDQTDCATYEVLQNSGNANQDERNCYKLNAAGRYFDLGAVRVGDEGTYHFMSSRNNNFTNRAQKSSIIVDPFLPIWAILLISIASAMCLGAVVVSGLAFYATTHPSSHLGKAWSAVI